MALARGIQDKLGELQNLCGKAVAGTERSGIRRPAHTLTGQLQQAQRWLANPALDDKGLGKNPNPYNTDGDCSRHSVFLSAPMITSS